MLPEGLTEKHIELAAKEIDRRGVPRQRRSHHYDLVLNGRKYPPKYVISLANRYATGVEYSFENFNAVEAKNYFENNGYIIIDRRLESIQGILLKILPNKIVRENCLNIISESIICADELGSNKWCLHLNNNKIRLFIGSLIVFTIYKEELWIALDKDFLKLNDSLLEALNNSQYWRWDKEGYPEYSRVPSRNGFYNPIDKNFELWNTIKNAHFEFIRNVANKFVRLQNRSQLNHVPELLEIIQDTLGRSLPKPDLDSNLDQEIEVSNEDESDQQNDTDTEKDAISKSRIGQGKFRTRLKIIWKNKCAVTSCSSVAVLRASHIKPWRNSDNFERLDQYNGLLLTPNLDVTFDIGLITFDKDGSILISSKLSEDQKAVLGIEETMRLRSIKEEHHKYLDFHRNNVFKPN